jgi:hypothetical protein
MLKKYSMRLSVETGLAPSPLHAAGDAASPASLRTIKRRTIERAACWATTEEEDIDRSLAAIIRIAKNTAGI